MELKRPPVGANNKERSWRRKKSQFLQYNSFLLWYSLTQTNGQGLRRHLKHPPVTSLQTGSVTRNLLNILLKHTVNLKFETGFQMFIKDLQTLIFEMINCRCIHLLCIAPSLGKHSRKKKRNFMKKFHKTVAPPPVLLLWNPYSEFWPYSEYICSSE